MTERKREIINKIKNICLNCIDHKLHYDIRLDEFFILKEENNADGKLEESGWQILAITYEDLRKIIDLIYELSEDDI